VLDNTLLLFVIVEVYTALGIACVVAVETALVEERAKCRFVQIRLLRTCHDYDREEEGRRTDNAPHHKSSLGSVSESVRVKRYSRFPLPRFQHTTNYNSQNKVNSGEKFLQPVSCSAGWDEVRWCVLHNPSPTGFQILYIGVMGVVVAVCGLPGSGKSYFASRLAERMNAVY